MTRLGVLLVCVVVLAACGGSAATRKPQPASELASIAQLRSAFAAQDGHPRLIVLISPT